MKMLKTLGWMLVAIATYVVGQDLVWLHQMHEQAKAEVAARALIQAAQQSSQAPQPPPAAVTSPKSDAKDSAAPSKKGQ